MLIVFRVQNQLLPSVNAAEEISESDSDSEVDTKKKRYRKEKVGFRDRKVSKYNLYFSILLFFIHLDFLQLFLIYFLFLPRLLNMKIV